MMKKGERKGQLCGKKCKEGDRCHYHKEQRMQTNRQKVGQMVKEKRETQRQEEELASRMKRISISEESKESVGFKMLYEDKFIRLFGSSIHEPLYVVATDIEIFLKLPVGHIARYCAKHGVKRIKIHEKRPNAEHRPTVMPYCFTEQQLYKFLISKSDSYKKAKELGDYFESLLVDLRVNGAVKLQEFEKPSPTLLEERLNREFEIVDDRLEWQLRDKLKREMKVRTKRGVEEMNAMFFKECDKVEADSSLSEEEQRARMLDLFFRFENEKYSRYGEKGMKYSAQG